MKAYLENLYKTVIHIYTVLKSSLTHHLQVMVKSISKNCKIKVQKQKKLGQSRNVNVSKFKDHFYEILNNRADNILL